MTHLFLSAVQLRIKHGPTTPYFFCFSASLSSVHESEEEPQGGGIEALKFHLSNLRELRKDVDHLREAISEQYAEYMGENLNCTTQ